jgi:hypothetical protein
VETKNCRRISWGLEKNQYKQKKDRDWEDVTQVAGMKFAATLCLQNYF